MTEAGSVLVPGRRPIIPRRDSRTNVLFIGVGGQGILTSISVLGEAALRAEQNLIMSEVHGMAQRGGTVVAHVRIGDVSSPLIPDWSSDAVVSLEPVEVLRVVRKISPYGYLLLNTEPIYPFTVSLGLEEYPDVEDIIDFMRGVTPKVIPLNAFELAKSTGSSLSVNMVMLGALAGTGILPFSSDLVRETISARFSDRFRDVNLRAYDLGIDRVSEIIADEAFDSKTAV